MLIKDLHTRCNLTFSLCRGQAYNGAVNMQGKRSGVAARFLSKNPAAIPVHCFAHSLNLCLQGIRKNVVSIRDAIEIVKEVGKLILYSPKRLHLFSSTLQLASDSGVSLKLLYPTRWTARTVAINARLKEYNVLLEVLEEIHMTNPDEYGTKAQACYIYWRNLIHFLA